MKYFIQDKRSYVGNDMLFWGKNHAGYTTDLNLAGQYSEEEAKEICIGRDTDVAWPVDYIMSISRPAVDMQYTEKSMIKKFN